MKHFAFVTAFSAIMLTMHSQAWASNTIACPDISKAAQIGECPNEDELKHMFKSGCGFERDPNAKKPELCDSYMEFKRRKNTALWESSDGEFMGYIACAIPIEKIKSSKLASIAVSQNKGLYKISCEYEGGIKFTYRTRSVCRVATTKSSDTVMRMDCSPGTSACTAECD